MKLVTLALTNEDADNIIKMCKNELHYKIHESSCCYQYEPEIRALLRILKSFDIKSYEDYKKEFEGRMEEENRRW